MIKNEKIDLAILLLTSLTLSIYLFFQTYVISLDGVSQYIPMAKVFASGFFKDAIRFTGQQPLYSFLIALLSRWVPDFEIAGKLISSFFGIMVIFPVYFLGKRIFDRKVAFLSAFLLVIHPYVRRYSADVLKESSYLFFLAAGIWFSLRAFEKDKIYPYIFIPFFSVMAYLIRPDGVEILLVVFFYILLIKKFSAPGKKWTVILLLLLASCALLFPYIFHLREITGEWTLSKAKSIVGILGWGVTKGEIPFITKIIYSLKKINLEIFAIYHPLFIFLLALGLLRKIFFHFKNEEKFLISFFVLHYLVLFLLIFNLTGWRSGEKVQEYVVSGRHVLPLLIISIYWVGEGFFTVYQWIYKKVESGNLLYHLESKKKSTIFLAALLILLLIIVLPKTLKPQRYERLTEKWAGIWIKNQSGKGMTIFTTVPRVAYYANGNYENIDFKKDQWDKVESSMVGKGALYLVIRERDLIDFPNESGSIKKNFIEVIRYENKGMEKIIVYKRIQ
jgi:hypothetical protein